MVVWWDFVLVCVVVCSCFCLGVFCLVLPLFVLLFWFSQIHYACANLHPFEMPLTLSSLWSPQQPAANQVAAVQLCSQSFVLSRAFTPTTSYCKHFDITTWEKQQTPTTLWPKLYEATKGRNESYRHHNWILNVLIKVPLSFQVFYFKPSIWISVVWILLLEYKMSLIQSNTQLTSTHKIPVRTEVSGGPTMCSNVFWWGGLVSW